MVAEAEAEPVLVYVVDFADPVVLLPPPPPLLLDPCPQLKTEPIDETKEVDELELLLLLLL